MKKLLIIFLFIAASFSSHAITFPVKPGADTSTKKHHAPSSGARGGLEICNCPGVGQLGIKAIPIIDEPFNLKISYSSFGPLGAIPTRYIALTGTSFSFYNSLKDAVKNGARLSDLKELPKLTPLQRLAILFDTVHLMLPDSLHAFALSYMRNKERIDVTNYQNFLVDSVETYKDSTGTNRLKNPGKLLTYSSPITLVDYSYRQVGKEPEGIVAHPNALVQGLLIQQLYPRRLDVLAILGEITEANRQELNGHIQYHGIDRIANIKR